MKMQIDRLNKRRQKEKGTGRVRHWNGRWVVPALRPRCLLAWLPACLCFVVVAFGWAAGASLQAGEGSKARPPRVDPHPDGDEPVMILEPTAAHPPIPPLEGGGGGRYFAEATAAGQGDTCRSFGGFSRRFPGSNRYRGNAFSMDQDATLNEFKMELQFTGTTELCFSVHKRRTVEDPFEPIFEIRVTPPDGVGMRTWYSTGLINPLDLVAGYQYAIGVAWGSREVTYGHDGQTYDPPMPFAFGQVEGSVAVNDQPTCPSLGSPTIFTNGVYSTQLCFDPVPGACCVPPDLEYPAGHCEPKLPSVCTDPRGWFHGDGTTCTEVVCRFSACCDPCGTCEDNYTPETCAETGGAFEFGAVCSTPETDLCPKITGACCTDTGDCNDTMCARECEEDHGDTYLGDGTTCEPNMCQGACCLWGAGGCTNTTSQRCDEWAGEYKGDGTTCATLPPEAECGGACCFGFDDTLDSCQEVSRRSHCTPEEPAPLTAYQGDATYCPPDCGEPSDYGACCLPDGTCINTTGAPDQLSGFCSRSWVNGDYQGDPTTCGPSTCTVGSCCFGDGSCRVLTQAACTGIGTWMQDGTCTPNICTTPTGACCGLAVSDCTPDATEEQCTVNDGIYQEDGTDCAIPGETCVGYGSCCRDNGECFDTVTADECGTLGGVYQADATTCAGPEVNCDQRGACCAMTGLCLFILERECDGILGDFKGIGVACDASTCPAGACCMEGQCKLRTAIACDPSAGHVYEGDGTTCEPEDLCVVGACCLPDETCEMNTRQLCERAGGTYGGAATTCDPADLCVVGACCLPDETCQLKTRQLCERAGEVYQGAAIKCEPDSCFVGACCLPDDTCEMKTLQLCERAAGVYQGAAIECEPDSCFVGACCLPDETCEMNTRPLCERDGGTYDGPATTCDPADLCVVGACCLPDETCDMETRQQCERAGGTYDEAATTCDPADLCVVGACCLPDETCEMNTRLLCERADGTYYGAATACEPADLCVVGACCLPDETCEMNTRQLCERAGGIYQGDAIDCTSGLCTLGGCCHLDGTCQDDAVASQCTGSNDDFRAGLLCDNFCSARGACCIVGEDCQLLPEPRCVNSGGDYEGDTELCRENFCTPGACCLADETTCVDVPPQTRQECERDGGAYLGPDAACTDADCTRGSCCEADKTCTDNKVLLQCEDPNDFMEDCSTCFGRGACCLADDPVPCQIRTRLDCLGDLGVYVGNATTCEPDECVCPPDLDGDVDLDDYFEFHACLQGPGGDLGLNCECFDFDGNDQVDLADFAEFLLVYTGPS